jgi:DNA-binding MarR family transcriptional regulator
MNSAQIEKEYAILENIYHQPEKVRQRDLAHIAGISLGMTNAILKRLINKGLVIARKINHRTIHYAVTPSGINEIMQRSYRYFKRTIKNIVFYKEKIKQLISDIAARGFKKIILVGESDLDFIIEHCAHQEGLILEQDGDGSRRDDDSESCFIIGEKSGGQAVDGQSAHVRLLDILRDTGKVGVPGESA